MGMEIKGTLNGNCLFACKFIGKSGYPLTLANFIEFYFWSFGLKGIAAFDLAL